MAKLGELLPTQKKRSTLGNILNTSNSAPIDFNAISVKQVQKSPLEIAASSSAVPKPLRATASAVQKTADFLFPRVTNPAEARARGLIPVTGPISGQPMYLDPTGVVGSMENISVNIAKRIAKSRAASEITNILKRVLPDASTNIHSKAAADLTTINTSKGVQAYLSTLAEDVKTAAKGTKQTAAPAISEDTVRTGARPLSSSGTEIERTSIQEAKPRGIRPSAEETLPSPSSIPREQQVLNLERLSLGDEGAAKLLQTIDSIRPELQKVRGGTLTNEEVLKAAQDSSILTKATSRDATLKSEAALLATRQNLTALAEGEGVSKDFIDQLRIVAAEATRRGRELQALGITADPIRNTTKGQIIKKLLDVGAQADEIVKAAEGVDFTNQKQLVEFYRKFVPPSFQELLDEYRYINLLSSPHTHIVNAFSNLLQGTVLNPATRLAAGSIDFVLSSLTGKERSAYVSEVAPYTRGFINAVPDALSGFINALKGNAVVERPDLDRIPSNSKLLKPFQAIPRALEGMDVFFRTLIQRGELEALSARAVKSGEELTPDTLASLQEQAARKAEYYVFRGGLDSGNKDGQGRLLSGLDQLTTAVYQLRRVPGVKWFVPFVQTPMNIFKQGIEHSPLGFATLPGASNKAEQAAKALVGSTVFLGAGALALQGRLSWAAPTSQKEKNEFYNSGRQPYSIKVGDTWVSFSKLGPLAYPIAMAAAIQWYVHENPKAATQSSFERAANAFNGIAKFFSDQSYLQGLQSLLEVTSGDTRLSGIQSVFSSTAGQLIPLSSFQRFAAHIIDPVYRKPDSNFSARNLIQSLEKDIPFLSRNVPAIEGASERQLPVFNSISPVNVTEQNPAAERRLQQIRRQQARDARLNAIKEKSSARRTSSLADILK